MSRPYTKIEVGTRFGKLKFIEDAGGDEKKRRLGKFLCDCGNEKILRTHSVTCGQTLSCGCMRGMAHAVSEEEKQRMIEMSKSMSPYAIAQQLNRDRITVRDIVKPKPQKHQTSEGFFDYDAYVKSDFILQS